LRIHLKRNQKKSKCDTIFESFIHNKEKSLDKQSHPLRLHTTKEER
jgi:hypothetical protein